MARRKTTTTEQQETTEQDEPVEQDAATATMESDPSAGGADSATHPEEDLLFPELDTTDPKHKALLRAARAFGKAKAERSSLLTTSKEKVDGLQEKLLAAMHESQLSKFRHEGVTVEVIPSSENVEVKIEDESRDEE